MQDIASRLFLIKSIRWERLLYDEQVYVGVTTVVIFSMMLCDASWLSMFAVILVPSALTLIKTTHNPWDAITIVVLVTALIIAPVETLKFVGAILGLFGGY